MVFYRLYKYLIDAPSIHIHNLKAEPVPLKMIGDSRDTSKLY